MDEVETKTCLNCKREIPAVNFTIHSVHCARNIKMCPVCKEPVPHAELQEHHEKLHKLLPCKKCGESVCGTDLEDHVRDSCAHTIKSCRFCELELPRREIPAHENYCGVRTEQCADCREWVMLKYRQLHVDSNHGFIRLDDEPAPQPKKELPKLTRIPKPINTQPAAPWRTLAELSAVADQTNGCLKNNNVERPRTEIRRLRPSSSAEPIAGGSGAGGGEAEGQRLPVKRTNDQPQINTNVAATDKVNKDLNMSRGAVKKRPAPKPPSVPKPDARRDRAYYSAVQRQQDEERQRLDQSAINLARGLPPVLNPAAKLERLRKMDALHNRETEPDHTRQGPSRLQPEEPARWQGPSRLQQPEEPARRLHASPDERHSLPDRRNEFSNLKPMSPDEFMRRFNALQMENCRSRALPEHAPAEHALPEHAPPEHAPLEHARSGLDRFSEIKSSLRELRRGLNEVTAPYNANSVNNDLVPERNEGDRFSSSSSSGSDAEHELVRLPCEFCDRPVPLHDLVRHQTGCRPDLAQIKAPRRKHRHHETLLQQELQLQHQLQQQQLQQQQELFQHEQLLAAARAAAEEYEDMNDLPVIPCEFCTESLPVYLISEHQERCRRDGPMLYPD